MHAHSFSEETSVSSRDTAAVTPYIGTAYMESSGKLDRARIHTLSHVGMMLRPYWRQVLLSLLTMIVATSTTLAGPRIIGYFVDVVLVPRDVRFLSIFAALFAACELLRLTAGATQAWLIGGLGLKVVDDIRVKVMNHLMYLKLENLQRHSSGQLVSRVIADTGLIGQMFTAAVVNIVEKVLVVCSAVITMLVLNLKLAAISLVLFPVLAVAAVAMSRAVYSTTLQSRERSAGVVAFLSETLAGANIVRIFDRHETQRRRFGILSTWLRDAQLKPQRVNAFFHPGMTLFNAVSMATLIVFGGAMVQNGEIPLGLLVAFFSYLLWLFWPIIHIVNQWSILVSGFAAAERVFEVLDWAREERARPQRSEHIRGAIRFDGVWFAYVGEEWVLRDLSFSIQPGDRVGIVGTSGSGKSTILALLLRFYEPQRGTIYLDDIPLNSLPIPTLRQAIGLVEQEGALFSGTVEENLRVLGLLSEQDPMPSNHLEMLDAVTLDRDVSQLSAGERQWVAFTRIAMRAPAVWALDEAAAHLDPVLDARLHDVVESRAGGRTVLVVAHRIASVLGVDLLLVMHHGKLVEWGAPSELIASDGLFAKMTALQK